MLINCKYSVIQHAGMAEGKAEPCKGEIIKPGKTTNAAHRYMNQL